MLDDYLIMYKGDRSGDVLWWRPERAGYTVDISQAARYCKDEADSIARIRGMDFPVPFAAIGTLLSVRQVVCIEDGDNFTMLKSYMVPPQSDTGEKL